MLESVVLQFTDIDAGVRVAASASAGAWNPVRMIRIDARRVMITLAPPPQQSVENHEDSLQEESDPWTVRKQKKGPALEAFSKRTHSQGVRSRPKTFTAVDGEDLLTPNPISRYRSQ